MTITIKYFKYLSQVYRYKPYKYLVLTNFYFNLVIKTTCNESSAYPPQSFAKSGSRPSFWFSISGAYGRARLYPCHFYTEVIMQKSEHKLAQYALLSSAFLATHAANADVIYTDLHPDICLTEFNSSAYVDLNADGLNDYRFLNWNKHFTTYNSYGEPMHEFELFVQWVGPAYYGLNRIAGETYFEYRYNIGVYVYYFPYKLASGDVISSYLNFYPHWINQSMAFKQFTADDDTPRLFDTGGYWAPGAEEQFLGVYFADTNDSMHYGWIRCSIIDTANGLIIHDYAYESEPEKPIIAGATFANAGLTDAGEFTLYTHNNSVYLYVNADTIQNLTLDILDMHGRTVFSCPVEAHFLQQPLQVPNGIYFARILNRQKVLHVVKCYL